MLSIWGADVIKMDLFQMFLKKIFRGEGRKVIAAYKVTENPFLEDGLVAMLIEAMLKKFEEVSIWSRTIRTNRVVLDCCLHNPVTLSEHYLSQT